MTPLDRARILLSGYPDMSPSTREHLVGEVANELGERYTRDEVYEVLKNVGVDVSCGACMSVALTGATTAEHTCGIVSSVTVEGNTIRVRVVNTHACATCNGTGVVDSGNNELPCRCPAGDVAVFNVAGRGRVLGMDLKAGK